MHHLVVNPVEVGMETLVEPPASVADLSTDVAGVWRAEALLIVVPAEGILHRAGETQHMKAVLVLLVLDPVGETETSFTHTHTRRDIKSAPPPSPQCKNIYKKTRSMCRNKTFDREKRKERNE